MKSQYILALVCVMISGKCIAMGVDQNKPKAAAMVIVFNSTGGCLKRSQEMTVESRNDSRSDTFDASFYGDYLSLVGQQNSVSQSQEKKEEEKHG